MSFEIALNHALGERTIALDFASDDKVTALVGVSGAGKTTILNAIAGLLRPDAGRIVVAGETLFDSAAGIDLPPERRHVGYVFQDARLFPHMKVCANIDYGARRAAAPAGWITRTEAVSLLGIGDLLDRWPATLSGGETRRVAIARALLCAPRFLLLDEPMASLDQQRAERLRRMIEEMRDRLDVPILLVSHDRAEVERLAGRIVEVD